MAEATGFDTIKLKTLVVTGAATIPGLAPTGGDLTINGDLTVTGSIGAAGASFDTGLDAGSIIAKSYETIRLFAAGAMTVATKKAFALCGVSGTIIDARIAADTGPVGAALIVDINKNGTTIFTTQGNRPAIADGQTASPQAIPDVVTLAVGDIITVDCDAIGSGTAGSNLMVVIRLKSSLVD